MTYDSRPETYAHSLRVGELMGQLIKELIDRSLQHDRSKTETPEVDTFNEYTPKLKQLTYGTQEYFDCLKHMGPALQHHYANNRHHPEHYTDGIDGMTLVDLVEMLADWKAATERMADGSLTRSLTIQQERFDISPQLFSILENTARMYGWLDHHG